MQQQQQAPVTQCGRCGAPLAEGQLACAKCGAFTYQHRLDELAGQALRLEAVNPGAAAMIWREALGLIPFQSPHYRQIYDRIGALAAGWGPVPQGAYAGAGGGAGGGAQVSTLEYERRGVRPPDPWPLAVAKTSGSMLFSAAVYYVFLFHNLTVAVGFVVLMLIHELGHSLAMRYYGLSASPPIFIPFMGAVINMRQSPPNALVESVVGIGGPLLGTAGALACYALAMSVQNPALHMELLLVAQLAFMLNLFNLLPVPPLDGGRITAAISPWLWLPGLAGLAALMYEQIKSGGGFGIVILGLVLFYALPRIRATLRARGMKVPYYQVSATASWTMGVVYAVLAGVLFFMYQVQLGGLELFRG